MQLIPIFYTVACLSCFRLRCVEIYPSIRWARSNLESPSTWPACLWIKGGNQSDSLYEAIYIYINPLEKGSRFGLEFDIKHETLSINTPAPIPQLNLRAHNKLHIAISLKAANLQQSDPGVISKFSQCLSWKSMPMWATGKVHNPSPVPWNSRTLKVLVRRMWRRDWGEQVKGWEPVGWTYSNLNAVKVSMTQQLVCGFHTDRTSTFLNCLCRGRESCSIHGLDS